MIEEFIKIRQKLANVQVVSGSIKGELKPNKEEIAILYQLTKESCVDEVITHSGKSKLLSDIGSLENIAITLYPPYINDGKYYETLEDFITHNSQQIPTEKYYIHSLGYYSDDIDKPLEIEQYISVVKLIELLCSVADHKQYNENYQELFFYQSNRLILKTSYSAKHIRSISNINQLTEQLTDQHDKKERRTIFISEMINTVLLENDIEKSFLILLDKFDDIFNKYEAGYNCYLEHFSYEKIKSEFAKEKLLYITNIQGVVNNIQSKLISVPAAFLLIVSQFDLSGEKVYTNSVLCVSAFIFSFLLNILIKNQKNALTIIIEDFNIFKQAMNERNKNLLLDFPEEIIDNVEKTANKQKDNLNLLTFIIWSVFGMSIIMMIILIWLKYFSVNPV
jgi:hypothetical protein